MYDETRFRSGVRQLCKWRHEWGIHKFREYLSNHKLDSELLNAYADQWKKGNRGTWGEWID